MKLLYLAATEFPIRQARGIQVAQTSAALAAAGHDVVLVIGGPNGPDAQASFAYYGLAAPPNLRLVRLPAWRPPGLPAGPRWTALGSRVWSLVHLSALALLLPMVVASEQPTAVFARTLQSAEVALSTPIVRSLPLFFELHFLDSVNAADSHGEHSSKARRFRAREQRVLQRSRGIVTLTSAARDFVSERYRLPFDHFLVAPSASVGEPAVSDSADVPREHGLVVYAGQFHDWKGVETLVRALALTPSARLEILGGLGEHGRPDPGQQRLHALAVRYGVIDRVTFAGAVPYTVVQERLRLASIAAIPLRDGPIGRLFTSPLKLYDYMHAGAAIVASDLPSLRDTLRHGENSLLVAPESPEALAAALKMLLDDDALCRALSERATLDAHRCTWAARADALAAFMEARLSSDAQSVDPARLN